MFQYTFTLWAILLFSIYCTNLERLRLSVRLSVRKLYTVSILEEGVEAGVVGEVAQPTLLGPGKA